MRKLALIASAAVFVMLFCCNKFGGQPESIKTDAAKTEPAAAQEAPEKIFFNPPAKYDDYKKDWDKVTWIEGQGKPRSALDVVEFILKDARAKKNTPQIVKALIYRTKYVMNIGEKDFPKVIKDLEDEAKAAEFPANAVMSSMLAEIYWNYFNQNRYRFYNRTETQGAESADIATWSLKTIMDRIKTLHTQALQYPENLKRARIDLFDELIVKGTKSRVLRPSLYDFIAHRAIDFYSYDESQLPEAVYTFQIDSPGYFNPAAEFIALKIDTQDKDSLSYRAFKLLGELTRSHLNDSSPDALIDIELKRLGFVNRKSVLDNKEELYLAALDNLEKKYASSPMSSMVRYEIAKWYQANAAVSGGQFGSVPPEKKDYLKKARDICAKVAADNKNTEAVSLCKALISLLETKSLSMTAESANTPEKPFRMLLTSHNVKKLFLKAVSVSHEQRKSFTDYSIQQEKVADMLADMKAEKEWTIDIPDTGDLRSHTMEIKIPPLNMGPHAIIAGTEKNYSYKNRQAIFWTITNITNLAVIHRSGKDGAEFFVTDRESGRPLEDATVYIYERKYDYSSSKYVETKLASLDTDKNGIVLYKNKKSGYNYNQLYAVVTKNGDRLSTDFYNGYNQEPKPYQRTFFFTDRAIYRPGQTIYFKGIMLSFDPSQKPKILAGTKTTVEFLDVNWQKITNVELTTNEFGSFHGSFTAPTNLLNGNMTIRNYYGQASFSVEEYKRPKFETKFEPVKESFKLGDEVKVTGKAESYSGAPLTEAKVAWRVERSTYFPYWYWGWDYDFYSGKKTVIGRGTVTTNAKGKYIIPFKAVPNLAISKAMKPAFTYTVYADVTDINGETHSTQTFVKVGYVALSVDVNIPGEVNTSEKLELNLNTANLNGEFEPAKGTIKISKLKEPERLLRKRLWQKPDTFMIPEADYKTAFPNDIYRDEDEPASWKPEKEVFTAQFDTSKEKKLLPGGAAQWADGHYILEIESADKYGEKIEYKRNFTVYSPKAAAMTENSFSKFILAKPAVEPGGKGQFIIGSAAQDVTILFDVLRSGRSDERQVITLNREKKTLTVPVTEADRGNIGYSMIFQKNGRVYYTSGVINVPWTNKQLKMEFMTFRDKLYPGQKEEWRMTISGQKAEKEASEMVAAMHDQSLDSFRGHYWDLTIHPSYYFYNYWQENNTHTTVYSMTVQPQWNNYVYGTSLYYDSLNWFGTYFYGYYNNYGYRSRSRNYDFADDVEVTGALMKPSAVAEENEMPAKKMVKMKKLEAADESKEAGDSAGYGGLVSQTATISGEGKAVGGKDGFIDNRADIPNKAEPQVQIRKNLQETAFFYPMLKTNEKGEIVISFTMPEALTKWRFMGLAHTKDLKTGLITKDVVTQKDLMVMPNMPRFLREGDSVIISAKISNLVDKELSGDAELKLFDAATMEPVDAKLGNSVPSQPFKVAAKGNTVANWPVKIPIGIGAVTWRVTAKSGAQGDGEEATIPVLSNRMLVTESMPLPVKGGEKKEFLFKKLIESGKSDTIAQHRLTLEFTSNPVWYAVQALPYLMEYPYECAEQVFSRFYANSLASHIVNSSPNIKQVFDQWKNTDALMSNLQKNEELKSVLLQETPWVLDAKDEEQSKKRVALLFDLNRMGNELGSAVAKLRKMQGYNGGWPWFEGLPESRYITQHIISGLGKLRNLKVKEADSAIDMARKGVYFVDAEMKRDYDLLKQSGVDMSRKNISYMEIHYLYTRSFFVDMPVSEAHKEAFDYWKGQAVRYWLGETPYMNGMAAAALQRLGEKAAAKKIVDSLRERAIYNDELGMYFKENMGGYYWYQFPIETQAVIIEAFQEVTKDIKTVDNLKTWLLKMKQVQDWKTTKATVDACYALLMGGSDWLKNTKNADITLGSLKIDPVKMGASREAGTGHFKVAWNGGDIKPEMSKVTVVNPNSNPAWGALYWQYFEQLDKITPHETPLKLEKKIFREVQTDKGPILEPLTNNAQLKPGDRLKVRIILRSDRDMEFIHMKDMRAAGTEPENVISRHKYQDGLWYYESTKDVSTNFFIERLNQGTFVFEYPLRVNLKGNFSAGITTIQCMYAPEFTAHSEGIRVEVK